MVIYFPKSVFKVRVDLGQCQNDEIILNREEYHLSNLGFYLFDTSCCCIQDLAIDATTTAGVDLGQGMREVDIKKYIKVEKVPGGQLEDSRVLKGVMINKDVVNPGKMRRKIVNPRIILLDCPVEYKKGENQTNAELMKEEDW